MFYDIVNFSKTMFFWTLTELYIFSKIPFTQILTVRSYRIKHFQWCSDEVKSTTVGSNTVRALEIICVKKLIPNGILGDNLCQVMTFRLYTACITL